MPFSAAPDEKRNFGVLAGYFIGLAARDPLAVEAFRNEAVQSTVFGPLLPFVCQQIGITPKDVTLYLPRVEVGNYPSAFCFALGLW